MDSTMPRKAGDSPDTGVITDVTGISRSGRVRKKSSKLTDFESPDEIDTRFKRKVERPPKSPHKSMKLMHPVVHTEGSDMYEDSDGYLEDDLLEIKDEPLDVDDWGEDDDDDMGDDDNDGDLGSESLHVDEDSMDIPKETTNYSQAQSLYLSEKQAKKNIMVKDGQVVQRKKAQRKDKGKSRFTAYMLWAREIRPGIIQGNQNMDFSAVNKRLGELWALVPTTQKYNWKRRAKRLAAKGNQKGSMISTGKAAKQQQNSTRSNLINKGGAKLQQVVRPSTKNSDVAQSGGGGGGASGSSSGGGGGSAPTPKVSVSTPKTSRSAGSSTTDHSPPSTYKVTGRTPIDVAAHIKLLGESLNNIGQKLKEHEDVPSKVSGSKKASPTSQFHSDSLPCPVDATSFTTLSRDLSQSDLFVMLFKHIAVVNERLLTLEKANGSSANTQCISLSPSTHSTNEMSKEKKVTDTQERKSKTRSSSSSTLSVTSPSSSTSEEVMAPQTPLPPPQSLKAEVFKGTGLATTEHKYEIEEVDDTTCELNWHSLQNDDAVEFYPSLDEYGIRLGKSGNAFTPLTVKVDITPEVPRYCFRTDKPIKVISKSIKKELQEEKIPAMEAHSKLASCLLKLKNFNKSGVALVVNPYLKFECLRYIPEKDSCLADFSWAMKCWQDLNFRGKMTWSEASPCLSVLFASENMSAVSNALYAKALESDCASKQLNIDLVPLPPDLVSQDTKTRQRLAYFMSNIAQQEGISTLLQSSIKLCERVPASLLAAVEASQAQIKMTYTILKELLEDFFLTRMACRQRVFSLERDNVHIQMLLNSSPFCPELFPEQAVNIFKEAKELVTLYYSPCSDDEVVLKLPNLQPRVVVERLPINYVANAATQNGKVHRLKK